MYDLKMPGMADKRFEKLDNSEYKQAGRSIAKLS